MSYVQQRLPIARLLYIVRLDWHGEKGWDICEHKYISCIEVRAQGDSQQIMLVYFPITADSAIISLPVGVSKPEVPGPTSKLSSRAPAQMGRRETEREGGEGSRRETCVRGGIPWPSCLSRAQVGCACSRGLQASTREGASGLTRAPSRPSPRDQPSVRGPWSFLL
jgi:hypothetical protein